MNGPDDELEAEVRRVVEAVDPVPVWVLEAAKVVLDWRQIDAVLAELAYDSHAEDRLAAGVRHAGGGARLLSFADPQLTVDIEVHDDEHDVRLVGQIVPAGAGDLTARHRGGEQHVAIDAMGRFSVEGIVSGPLQLVIQLSDGTVVQTASVVV